MVFRFIRNTQTRVAARLSNKITQNSSTSPIINSDRSTIPAIDSVERRKALYYWVRIAQQTYFHKEIKCCLKKTPLPNDSTIIKLMPQMDKEGLLRVGGRLAKANIPEEAKHQLILPPHARISQLIIRNAHFVTLHGGPQLMLAHLRRSIWITRMRQIIKSVVHHCPVCIRFAHTPNDQLMGDLPTERINQAEPFLHTGVDFAGPFMVKKSAGRPSSSRNRSNRCQSHYCNRFNRRLDQCCIGMTYRLYLVSD